ncbi:cation diffusion facilitator family transporter [Streptomyces sp. NPDC059740]|uniref:cation diffusion facilitator family transporter n=1 Tax=Streptomyces sp. NPDC059740 TaxID=3346926 RepID=UPI00364769D9
MSERTQTPDDPGSDRPEPESGDSTFTVVVAAAANLGVAVAKAVAGLISGSSAMLSEAAHSLADTVTEILLLTALKRSQKPADEEHPLGYGPERYVWALLASVATFVGGAVFSVYDGVHTLTHGEEIGSPTASYCVLALAFLLEGFSLRTGVRQSRREAASRDRPFLHYLRHTSDTAVKAVVLEDTAALAGLLLAALGLLLEQLTGAVAWDGTAAIAIGVLLALVAWELGRSNVQLLIGRALPRAMREELRAELLALPAVVEVVELTTLVQGPREVLVAAKVDFEDGLSAGDIEQSCEEAERRLRSRLPSVCRVYLDPTPGRGTRAR